jgi:hypothetical protein
VLGGNMIMTFCVIQAQGVAEAAHGAGQVLFVGGGTMILTGVDFRFASACLLFTGIGDFFVGGGVMVFTGVTIENAYPILAAYGAGFYLAVGGGVMVETGVTYVQFNGPAHLALTGASIFMGAGTSIHTGVPASFYGTTVFFSGQGGFSYSGAGYTMWLGCPIAVFAATFAFVGLGGLISQPAGFMVYIGNPAFVPAAIVWFAGAGVVMFLGAGAAVIGGSPVYAPAFIFRGDASPGGEGANYYVAGNTVSASRVTWVGLGGVVGLVHRGSLLARLHACLPASLPDWPPSDPSTCELTRRVTPLNDPQQDYNNGIGYFDKTGAYGSFWAKPEDDGRLLQANMTAARQVSNKEAFDGAIRKLKTDRKLSVANVHSILADFAETSDGGSTVGALA